MYRRHHQQRDRERDVDVKPRFEDVLVALLVVEFEKELFPLLRDDQHLAQLLLLLARDVWEKSGPLGGGSHVALSDTGEEQSPSRENARPRLAHQFVMNPLKRN